MIATTSPPPPSDDVRNASGTATCASAAAPATGASAHIRSARKTLGAHHPRALQYPMSAKTTATQSDVIMVMTHAAGIVNGHHSHQLTDGLSTSTSARAPTEAVK